MLESTEGPPSSLFPVISPDKRPSQSLGVFRTRTLVGHINMSEGSKSPTDHKGIKSFLRNSRSAKENHPQLFSDLLMKFLSTLLVASLSHLKLFFPFFLSFICNCINLRKQQTSGVNLLLYHSVMENQRGIIFEGMKGLFLHSSFAHLRGSTHINGFSSESFGAHIQKHLFG